MDFGSHLHDIFASLDVTTVAWTPKALCLELVRALPSPSRAHPLLRGELACVPPRPRVSALALVLGSRLVGQRTRQGANLFASHVQSRRHGNPARRPITARCGSLDRDVDLADWPSY